MEPRVPNKAHPAITQQTLAIVLAGGRGMRLDPLTRNHAKPAVEFGAGLRLIDFTLANCVNSGMRRMAVLTQYKAQSLLQHIQDHWSLPRRLGEFIDVVPAQQRCGDDWYLGTSDAVAQNSALIDSLKPDYVLVLGGDHVYKMDYATLLVEHVATQADVSISCVEVPLDAAGEFGVVEVNERRWIVDWQEKPHRPRCIPGKADAALASMGIYVFNRDALETMLAADRVDVRSTHDFGHDLIPAMVRTGWRVHAHAFADSCVGSPYWRDVGTLDAYWEANVEVARGESGFDVFDPTWPIAGPSGTATPARFRGDRGAGHAVVADSWIGQGCIIGSADIRSSIVFDGARVHDDAILEESLVLPGADIGPGARLRRAIVDRHCQVPAGLRAGFDLGQDQQRFHVTAGGIRLISPDMAAGAAASQPSARGEVLHGQTWA